MRVTRFLALLPASATLGGICPACDGVMDETGCRIAGSWRVKAPARQRTGIAHVVEVFCSGIPTAPIRPCPSCEARDR